MIFYVLGIWCIVNSHLSDAMLVCHSHTYGKAYEFVELKKQCSQIAIRNWALSWSVTPNEIIINQHVKIFEFKLWW